MTDPTPQPDDDQGTDGHPPPDDSGLGPVQPGGWPVGDEIPREVD